MRYLGNSLLLGLSLFIALLAGEGLARLVLNPVDFLLPQVVPDQFLSYRIQPYSGGHDAWGFRNARVPQSAEIVCIGDSMTYGEQARESESWPAALAAIDGATVYNMSLGGYGPTEYLYLMQNKAVKLDPKIVIVGFFVGNDLSDAYNEVNFNKNWATYANLNGPDKKAPKLLALQPPAAQFFGGFRNWLSRHSLLFAVLLRTSMLDFLRQRELQSRMARDPGEYFAYRDQNHDVVFNLRDRELFNVQIPSVKTGMNITKKVMLDMRRTAEANSFRLIVALIPTKERVYANLLARAGYVRKYPRLADLVHDEDTARDELSAFLGQEHIETIDLLPALEMAADKQDLYPLSNMHPNGYGYSVIARTVGRYLRSSVSPDVTRPLVR